MSIKNLKMKTIIITIFAITVALGIALLCILSQVNSNAILEEKINDNMTTYLDAQEKAVERFVEDAETVLKLYSKSSDVVALIEEDAADLKANPGRTLPEFNDESYNTVAYYTDNYKTYGPAQAYTMDYYGGLENWEGLYAANLETRILSYSVPPVIGRVLRPEEERRNELLSALNANVGGVYNAGIIMSPGTGKLCLSMYAPVMKNDEMIGYVGGGVFHFELEDLLKETTLTGAEESNFYMINTATKITYTDTEASEAEQEAVIAQETTRPLLLEVIQRSGTASSDQFEFKDAEAGKTYVVNYKLIPGRDWAVVIAADKDQLYSASRSMALRLTILSLIAFALIITLSVVAVTVTTKPLETITGAIRNLGDLNLTENDTIKPYVGLESEVGQIATAVDSLSSTLSHVVDNIMRASDIIQNQANELSDTSAKISDTTNSVSSAVQEIARGATEQAGTVEKSSENLTTLSNAIRTVSSQAEGLASAAEQMNSVSLSSAESLKQLSSNMDSMGRSVADITQAMSATNEAVQNVNEKVDGITSIASQTNLLALNASIEAARAGDAGRGFAVVAEEIGKLASQSAETAQEIRKEMTNLLVQAQDALGKTDEVSAIGNDVNEVLANTVDRINELIGNVSSTVDGVTTISDLAEECDVSKVSIVDAMNMLSSISEQNAASTEETSASMMELNEMITLLSDSSENLNKIVEELHRDLSSFTI